MIVADLMTRAVITVPPETPVLDARQEMLKRKLRHLPVIGPDRELLGIVTDRDIRLSLPSQATSLSVWELNYLLTKLTVEQVMTRTVITVGPERPAPDAARLMLDQKIGALRGTVGRHRDRDRYAPCVRPDGGSRPGPAPMTSGNLMGKLVLVVDDEVDFLTTYERLLRHLGYEVVTATSRAGGIDAVGRKHPALVISDLRLLDGS